MRYALGVDIGSISAKMAVIGEDRVVRASSYVEIKGAPIGGVIKALDLLQEDVERQQIQIDRVGVTGSSRNVASLILGADVVKNEVTAQAIGVLNYFPEASSIIEIGGQDSKIIMIKNGLPVWHNLNTLCAAGTGSFLASQAFRLNMPIEDFGAMALLSEKEISISTRCTVFSESDMVHKAALGYRKEDIVRGLCRGLVRNFLNNVAKNRQIREPVVFVGGVAANKGVVESFEEELKCRIIVPLEHRITGCVGIAIIAMRESAGTSKFKGFGTLRHKINSEVFTCADCPNKCQVSKITTNGEIGYFNSICDKYSAKHE